MMICPYCGETIHAVDTLDSEWDGAYYDTVEGSCPNCGRIFQWEEVYTFVRYENVREIDPNNHL